MIRVSWPWLHFFAVFPTTLQTGRNCRRRFFPIYFIFFRITIGQDLVVSTTTNQEKTTANSGVKRGGGGGGDVPHRDDSRCSRKKALSFRSVQRQHLVVKRDPGEDLAAVNETIDRLVEQVAAIYDDRCTICIALPCSFSCSNRML